MAPASPSVNLRLCCDYASRILHSRWKEIEQYILEDPHLAYEYAYSVIDGRWSEAEPIIMKNPDAAFWYTRFLIRSPWPEAEKFMKQDKETWQAYKDLLSLGT